MGYGGVGYRYVSGAAQVPRHAFHTDREGHRYGGGAASVDVREPRSFDVDHCRVAVHESVRPALASDVQDARLGADVERVEDLGRRLDADAATVALTDDHFERTAHVEAAERPGVDFESLHAAVVAGVGPGIAEGEVLGEVDGAVAAAEGESVGRSALAGREGACGEEGEGGGDDDFFHGWVVLWGECSCFFSWVSPCLAGALPSRGGFPFWRDG